MKAQERCAPVSLGTEKGMLKAFLNSFCGTKISTTNCSNKSSISFQPPGCLTHFSHNPLSISRSLQIQGKIERADAKLLTFLHSFCFCGRNDSQIEIHMVSQPPRSYYEYLGSVLVPSFAILGRSSSASCCLIARWVTEKDKDRLFAEAYHRRTRDRSHRCSKGNSG